MSGHGGKSGASHSDLRQALRVPDYFHVTSSLNRASIAQHGLDWTRMAAAPGIAGSRQPEVEGCFLCVEPYEQEWFVDMNNTGGTVDVWQVTGVAWSELVESPNGLNYVPRRIPPVDLQLVRTDLPPQRHP